jgi:ribosomal protein L24E
MNQQCGQTWLQTFSKISSMYNSGKPLPYLQLVTWNDYEEATEIESGIDNCLTVSASTAANSLQWSVSGNENTVDHYTVYISEDGENLMPLTDIASGIHSLSLCGFPIPDGDYKMFVQAAGKPTLANQISGATSYTATCTAAQPTPPPSPAPPPTPNPTLSFSASPASLTISAGAAGSLTVSAKPQSGSFNNSIALSCTGMPSTMSCSFSPASITPGSGVATSVVTISAKAATGTNPLPPRAPTRLYGSLLLSFGIVGFGFLGKGAGKRGAQGIALCAVVALGMLGASCGSARNAGSESAVAAATPVHYSVTIHGNSSASQISTTVNVIVQ